VDFAGILRAVRLAKSQCAAPHPEKSCLTIQKSNV
jgi:hypothetical protein